jgi:hypothetical protein
MKQNRRQKNETENTAQNRNRVTGPTRLRGRAGESYYNSQ